MRQICFGFGQGTQRDSLYRSWLISLTRLVSGRWRHEKTPRRPTNGYNSGKISSPEVGALERLR